MNNEYNAIIDRWEVLNDCYNENIKDKTTDYLPKTTAQSLDSVNGQTRYNIYLSKAKYYNFLKDTVDKYQNTITRKPPVIELPEILKDYRDNCNRDNESLESMLTQVYGEQLLFGRVGIMVDIENSIDRFSLLQYSAMNILDWKTEIVNGSNILTYVLLREWNYDKYLYRVLFLDEENGVYTYKATELKENKTEIKDIKILKENAIIPTYKGKTLNYIPFVFCNITHNKPDIEQPLLYNQATLSLGLYNLDADHSALCYKQAFSILFGSGMSREEASRNIDVDGYSTSENENAKLSYIGVNGAGLSELREEKINLRNIIESYGLTTADKNTAEASETLNARVQLNTDKLRTISKTGARALELALYIIADWMKLATKEISIIGNTDFRTSQEQTQELKNMSELYQIGTITEYDFWMWQKQNDYTSYEYNEWKNEIEKQKKEEIEINKISVIDNNKTERESNE